jgi:hypothetical protein
MPITTENSLHDYKESVETSDCCFRGNILSPNSQGSALGNAPGPSATGGLG